MRKTSLLIVFLLVSAAHGQWTWTKRQPYHNAVCRVVSQDGSAGSGALVDLGSGCLGVVTARHVTSTRFATCIFPTGDRWRGNVYAARNVDVSVVNIVPNPEFLKKVKPLQIAAASPPRNSWMEICGYGGPTSILRHYACTNLKQEYTQVSTGRCMNGDSGGPWLNSRHELIGVQSTGRRGQSINPKSGWPVYHESGSADFTHTRGFLRRVFRFLSGPGNR